MSHIREIRKITIGFDPKDAMVFLVGQIAAGGKSGYRVSSIIEEQKHFILFGIKRYNVYIATLKGDEVMWKSFEGVPVTLEYSLPGDVEDITVG